MQMTPTQLISWLVARYNAKSENLKTDMTLGVCSDFNKSTIERKRAVILYAKLKTDVNLDKTCNWELTWKVNLVGGPLYS